MRWALVDFTLFTLNSGRTPIYTNFRTVHPKRAMRAPLRGARARFARLLFHFVDFTLFTLNSGRTPIYTNFRTVHPKQLCEPPPEYLL
jgi:hypothetical protein